MKNQKEQEIEIPQDLVNEIKKQNPDDYSNCCIDLIDKFLKNEGY